MAEKRAAPLDFAAKYMEFGGSQGKLMHHYAAGKAAVKRWIAEQIDDSAPKTFELADLPKGRPAEMIEERGMDSAEWRVSSMSINEWEMNGDLQRQTKLTVTPVKDQVRAARVDGPRLPPPKPRKAESSWTDLICGDFQTPYHSEAFHRALCNLAADMNPRKWVDDGDLPDFPSVSKYPKKIGWSASANECIDGSHRIWHDRRTSSPDSECVQLEGNHCLRLAAKLLRDFEEGAGICRAGDDQPVLDLAYLLRLDELGVEFIGNYPHNIYKLSDDTAVIHGDKVKSGSGATGLATLMQRGYNVFMGHIHRQSITEHTWHDIDGNPFTRFAVEVGAGCLVQGGLGHTVNADWQIGAATATFHKDGSMHPELIMWDGKYLTWRGERWR